MNLRTTLIFAPSNANQWLFCPPHTDALSFMLPSFCGCRSSFIFYLFRPRALSTPAAARKSLEQLIPDFGKIVDPSSQSNGPSSVASERDLRLFDSILVTDPRLHELSVRMALPTPYNLLVECLNRSCIPEGDLKSNMTSQGRSRHFFSLQLRDHSVKVSDNTTTV